MTQLENLKNELLDMVITIRQLEGVEDYCGADYSDIISDVRWSHHQCKSRLTDLTRPRRLKR